MKPVGGRKTEDQKRTMVEVGEEEKCQGGRREEDPGSRGGETSDLYLAGGLILVLLRECVGCKKGEGVGCRQQAEYWEHKGGSSGQVRQFQCHHSLGDGP